MNFLCAALNWPLGPLGVFGSIEVADSYNVEKDLICFKRNIAKRSFIKCVKKEKRKTEDKSAMHLKCRGCGTKPLVSNESSSDLIHQIQETTEDREQRIANSSRRLKNKIASGTNSNGHVAGSMSRLRGRSLNITLEAPDVPTISASCSASSTNRVKSTSLPSTLSHSSLSSMSSRSSLTHGRWDCLNSSERIFRIVQSTSATQPTRGSANYNSDSPLAIPNLKKKRRCSGITGVQTVIKGLSLPMKCSAQKVEKLIKASKKESKGDILVTSASKGIDCGGSVTMSMKERQKSIESTSGNSVKCKNLAGMQCAGDRMTRSNMVVPSRVASPQTRSFTTRKEEKLSSEISYLMRTTSRVRRLGLNAVCYVEHSKAVAGCLKRKASATSEPVGTFSGIVVKRGRGRPRKAMF